MGKNLHHTIRPFIEKALTSHMNVKKFEKLELEDFYAYKIYRNRNMEPIIVVLSDEYYFSCSDIHNKSKVLKNGGFILIARPEASDYEENEPENHLGIGKIGKLLGAINKAKFWEYERPYKD